MVQGQGGDGELLEGRAVLKEVFWEVDEGGYMYEDAQSVSV